mmetsp:Transcript_16130/g.41097  ORF Transcript_16130/g.41097 Transcript_16130/m.41097 type:complete len:253 (+) Transcript_16130:1410-2168(+)
MAKSMPAVALGEASPTRPRITPTSCTLAQRHPRNRLHVAVSSTTSGNPQVPSCTRSNQQSPLAHRDTVHHSFTASGATESPAGVPRSSGCNARAAPSPQLAASPATDCGALPSSSADWGELFSPQELDATPRCAGKVCFVRGGAGADEAAEAAEERAGSDAAGKHHGFPENNASPPPRVRDETTPMLVLPGGRLSWSWSVGGLSTRMSRRPSTTRVSPDGVSKVPENKDAVGAGELVNTTSDVVSSNGTQTT